jgi:UV DNA damage repair endonuclease
MEFIDGKLLNVDELNTRTTTRTHLNKLSKYNAEQKLLEIMQYNIKTIDNLIRKVASLPLELRMVRLSSDLLPMYSEKSYSYFWQDSSNKNYLSTFLNRIGEFARLNGVRLSMHPGQFTCLASNRPDVVDNSIAEFEYHADIARYMGYGKSFQDFKINVHVGGANGSSGILAALPRLSAVARNTITIENDEISWGIDETIKLKEHLALVLDIHHHLVKTNEYISPMDDRIKIIRDSWRGITPVIHYSQTCELVGNNFKSDEFPDLANIPVKEKRKHSINMYNECCNAWAKSHWEYADVMVECKSKNIGAKQLYDGWKL